MPGQIKCRICFYVLLVSQILPGSFRIHVSARLVLIIQLYPFFPYLLPVCSHTVYKVCALLPSLVKMKYMWRHDIF